MKKFGHVLKDLYKNYKYYKNIHLLFGPAKNVFTNLYCRHTYKGLKLLRTQ